MAAERTNLLLRRVRRHAAVATLLRSTVPAAADSSAAGVASRPVVAALLPSAPLLPAGHVVGSPFQEPPGAERDLATATAGLALGGAAPATSAAPVQASPAHGAGSRPAAVPAASASAATAGPPGPAAARAPVPPPAPVVSPPARATAPSPAPAVVPPAASTGSDDDQAEWRRLQTIFRRHQEKQAAAELARDEPVEPADVSAAGAVQRRTEGQPLAPPAPASGLRRPADVPVLTDARPAPRSGPPAPGRVMPGAGTLPLGPALGGEPAGPAPGAGRAPAGDLAPDRGPEPATGEEIASAPAHQPAQPAATPRPPRSQPAAPSESTVPAGPAPVFRSSVPPGPAPEPLSTPAPGPEAAPVAGPLTSVPPGRPDSPPGRRPAGPIDIGQAPPPGGEGQVPARRPAIEAEEIPVTAPPVAGGPRPAAQPAPPAALREDEDAAGPGGEPPGADPAEIPTQAWPLEAVWPVQRLEAAPDERWQPRDSAPEDVPGPPPGRPTASSIETIPPRRPRPAAPPSPAPPARGGQPVPGAGEAAADRTAGSLSPVEPEAGLVRTEIGPLPADLWHLLDETPPPQPADVPRHDAAAGHGPQQSAVVMRSLADTATAEDHPAPVQREAEAEPAAPAAPGAPAAAEVDTDALARQVYAEVKRRLAVEWERGRALF